MVNAYSDTKSAVLLVKIHRYNREYTPSKTVHPALMLPALRKPPIRVVAFSP